MKRFKKPKGKNVTMPADELKKMKQDLTDDAVRRASLLYMVAMKDEFDDFGYEEVKRVFVRANRYARYLSMKEIEMKDLAWTLEKDTGIRL